MPEFDFGSNDLHVVYAANFIFNEQLIKLTGFDLRERLNNPALRVCEWCAAGHHSYCESLGDIPRPRSIRQANRRARRIQMIQNEQNIINEYRPF